MVFDDESFEESRRSPREMADDDDDVWVKELDREFDKEFKSFSNECDDYNNFEEVPVFCSEEVVWEPSTQFGPPLQLECKEDETEFVVLGKVPKSRSDPGIQMKKSPLCMTLSSKIKCRKGHCRFAHTLDKVADCTSDCDNILLENNYYSGGCRKIHPRETTSNFSARLMTRVAGLKKFSFEFHERPSDSFVSDLLYAAQRVGVSEVDMRIVKPNMTLREFLTRRTSSEETDDSLEDVDIMLLAN